MKIEELRFEHLSGLNKLLNSIAAEGVWTVNKRKTFKERVRWFESYKRERRRGNRIVLVCVEQNEIIGSASAVRQEGKRNHVCEIGYQVKKEYRSRGVGSLLVKRLIEFLRKRGAKEVIAWVTETNEASINLLKKFNFEKVGKIWKGVRLSNRYCDYLLFQKEL